MQVTPATWDYVETVLVGKRIPRTTSGNVQVGVAYLDQLLREFRGKVARPGRVRPGPAFRPAPWACSARPGSTSPACSR